MGEGGGGRDKVNYNRFCVRDRGIRCEKMRGREWQRVVGAVHETANGRKMNHKGNRMKENTNEEQMRAKSTLKGLCSSTGTTFITWPMKIAFSPCEVGAGLPGYISYPTCSTSREKCSSGPNCLTRRLMTTSAMGVQKKICLQCPYIEALWRNWSMSLGINVIIIIAVHCTSKRNKIWWRDLDVQIRSKQVNWCLC